MKAASRIQNRFQEYSLKDCDCQYCLYYGGKRKGCTFGKGCCCTDEKEKAEKKKRKGN